MTTSKNYRLNGTQVVLFFDEDEARDLGLNIIETDEFSTAAVKYDDIKDRNDVTENMLYVPFNDAKEGDEIMLSHDAMDDSYECPGCRFCTKTWAKECHAYFEFSYEDDMPYRGSQLADLIDSIKYYTGKNDYLELESLCDKYNAEMQKHMNDVSAPDAMVDFNKAFKKVIGESFDEWKQRTTEFETWWGAAESVASDDENRADELAGDAIMGDAYDEPEAHLDYELIRYLKHTHSEVELMNICKEKVEDAASTTDSEAVKACAAQIVYNRIFA